MQTVPWPKQVFCLIFREDQSLLHRPRNSGREYVDGPSPLWVSTYTSYLLYKVQDPFSACRQSQGQNRFSVYFLGWTSLCFTDQETQEENVLGGPTPLWVSTYTSYLLYKVQDPFSACRQSHGQNRFFCLFFREDQSLLHRPRNSVREYVDIPTPLWVSTYTSYLLYKVQDPFSACRQSHGQNRFFCLFFREDQSLLHRPRNSGREYVDGPSPLWVSTYTSYLLYKVQDPFSACRQSQGQNRFSVYFLGWTSLCFTDQETQEENVLGGPTPLWVSTYTSYLLYKVQDPFSACRQSHGQNRFFCLFFREDQSLLHRPRNSGREYVDGPTPLWVCTYTSYLLYKVQDSFSACRQSHGQNRFSVIF